MVQQWIWWKNNAVFELFIWDAFLNLRAVVLLTAMLACFLWMVSFIATIATEDVSDNFHKVFKVTARIALVNILPFEGSPGTGTTT